MKYLIAGGGTGGHIYPALAIAAEINRRHGEAQVLYVGTKHGLESTLVPREGLNFKTIRVRGMPRKLNREICIAFKELILGLRDAHRIIKKFNPDVVIGTGGYVSGPVVYMASKKKIPTVIHEQNAFPGITNRILSRYVDRVFITFEEANKYFKHLDRVFITGNPIRNSIITVNLETAYKDLDINPRIPFILSFGGSGGQRKLNEAMLYVIKENISNNIQIIHITGERFFNDFVNKLEEDRLTLNNNIRILPYFHDVPKGINIADLVITSAGAITLAEISAVGVPSILIPKSYTAENHQEYNAKAFERNGAGLVILEKDLTGIGLNKAIWEIVGDKDRLMRMSQNSKNMGKVDATAKIVDIIDNLIG